jgi:hypothetical protein
MAGFYCKDFKSTKAVFSSIISRVPDNTPLREYALFARLLAERVYTAKVATRQIRDVTDFAEWLLELGELAEQANSLEEFWKKI